MLLLSVLIALSCQPGGNHALQSQVSAPDPENFKVAFIGDQGLFFILSGAGMMASAHDVFLRDQLMADNSIWRVCSWHKNQTAMQVGSKLDDVSWEPYEECSKTGAWMRN